MSDIPGHSLPNYLPETREDALFHYTTANGLIGIFESGEIWGTAYYCTNDEQELAAGKDVLRPLFQAETYRLAEEGDSRITTFRHRGVDTYEYADHFEQLITSLALSSLCAYITCFCKPSSKEDFHHGLLSQWRGYGPDGGYALHFSRKKLLAAIERTNKANDLNYDLQDVHYATDNVLKSSVLSHTDAFIREFNLYLSQLAAPLDFSVGNWRNPIPDLLGGPLESLLDYLVHTKNGHFGEERECRLSLIQPSSVVTPGARSVRNFNRSGLVVPYTTTPRTSFDILDCVEWIIIGPGPRMGARFKSVSQLVQQSARQIKVRASHIPYTRF